MEIAQFRQAVEKALSELIKTTVFVDAATRNWQNDQGNEEELYPFFNVILLRHLSCKISGLGYGKVKNKGPKIDCLCYPLDEARPFGVELKGPSKDKSGVSRGLEEDFKKLNTLVKQGDLSFGIAIGINLSEQDGLCTHHKMTINLHQVCVNIETKDTQQENPADAE